MRPAITSTPRASAYVVLIWVSLARFSTCRSCSTTLIIAIDLRTARVRYGWGMRVFCFWCCSADVYSMLRSFINTTQSFWRSSFDLRRISAACHLRPGGRSSGSSS